MEVKLAGPGAGKTTTLASQIIEANSNYTKNIYCISFTNSSTEVIRKKLLEYYDYSIPENIIISTIHAFLNRELIQPYNYFLYGDDYHSIVNFSLPGDQRYRKKRLKDLRESGILHAENIPDLAKYILRDKSNDRKLIKERRKVIKEMIQNYFSVVFVDEAQDITKEVKEVLLDLYSLGVDVKLIGDVNQDVNGGEILKEMIHEFDLEPEFISENHRCPSEHIEFSNQFIDQDEHQHSPCDKGGGLNFEFQDEVDNLPDYIGNFDLAYIYQKHAIFNTQNKSSSDNTYNELKIIFQRRLPQKSKEVLINKISSRYSGDLINAVVNNDVTIKKAVSKLFPYGKIENYEYMQLVEALTKDTMLAEDEHNIIHVNSIHNIKGLEKNTCLFIITNALMPYLLQDRHTTKMNSLLYVGLTRSSDELTLLFVDETINKYGKEVINTIFSSE